MEDDETHGAGHGAHSCSLAVDTVKAMEPKGNDGEHDRDADDEAGDRHRPFRQGLECTPVHRGADHGAENGKGAVAQQCWHGHGNAKDSCPGDDDHGPGQPSRRNARGAGENAATRGDHQCQGAFAKLGRRHARTLRLPLTTRATPATARAMPARATTPMVSPSTSHAMRAVTGGTRKKRLVMRDAS